MINLFRDETYIFLRLRSTDEPLEYLHETLISSSDSLYLWKQPALQIPRFSLYYEKVLLFNGASKHVPNSYISKFYILSEAIIRWNQS